MTLKEINDLLRDIFKEFLRRGYSHSDIANCFLDSQGRKRIIEFVEDDRDFNLKSVERIFESLGYMLTIIPMKDEITQTKRTVTEDFILRGEKLLQDYLQYLNRRILGKSTKDECNEGQHDVSKLEHGPKNHQEQAWGPSKLH